MAGVGDVKRESLYTKVCYISISKYAFEKLSSRFFLNIYLALALLPIQLVYRKG